MADVGYVDVLDHLTLPSWIHHIANSPQMVAELLDAIGQFESLPGLIEAMLADPIGNALTAGTELAKFVELLTVLGTSTIGGFSVSGGGQAIAGGSISFSSPGVWVPQLTHSSLAGTSGQIAKSASRAMTSVSQATSDGYDHTIVRSEVESGSSSRTVTTERQLDQGEQRRATGPQVRWRGRYVDIITGSIPVGVTLPSPRAETYDDLDQSISVEFDNIAADIEVDIWFDVTEHIVPDEVDS
jgi:hypothetical protein